MLTCFWIVRWRLTQKGFELTTSQTRGGKLNSDRNQRCLYSHCFVPFCKKFWFFFVNVWNDSTAREDLWQWTGRRARLLGGSSGFIQWVKGGQLKCLFPLFHLFCFIVAAVVFFGVVMLPNSGWVRQQPLWWLLIKRKKKKNFSNPCFIAREIIFVPLLIVSIESLGYPC